MSSAEVTAKRIKNILCIAEQGEHGIPYGKVEVFTDGPGGVRQVTLSVGFTQFGSNLGKVIDEYVERGGQYQELGEFEIKDYELHSNKAFKELLKAAGKDPIMQAVQEELLQTLYIKPAYGWAQAEGFSLPLSMLVICDSYLHSGSILRFLRNRFSEKTPAHGGDEKRWIIEYTRVRGDWLANHSNRLLRNTVYRTDYFEKLIEKEDWDLEQAHTATLNGMKPLEIS